MERQKMAFNMIKIKNKCKWKHNELYSKLTEFMGKNTYFYLKKTGFKL